MSNPPEIAKSQQKSQVARIERLLAYTPFWKRRRLRVLLLSQTSASFQLLCRIITQSQNTRWRNLWTFPLLYLPFVLLASILTAIFFDLSWPIVPTACGTPALIGIIQTGLARQREKAALDILYHTEDERSIGPLLETLDHQLHAFKITTSASLSELLPHLNSETLEAFSYKQRQSLYTRLDYAERDTGMELRLAVLTALQELKDYHGLGYIYLLATGQAKSGTAIAVKAAANTCLNYLLARLDFGAPEDLPLHIAIAYKQVDGDEDLDLPTYFKAILTIRKLLPQVTPANYREILSESQRHQLYRLARLRGDHPLFQGERSSIHKRALQREIISTAERLGDTCALESFQAFAQARQRPEDNEIYQAVCQALRILEPLAEREKLGQVLLRGAAAPDARPQELLRAAPSTASETDPAELLRATSRQDRGSA